MPYSDPDLPEGGLATDLARNAFQAAGVEAEIDFQSWRRGYDATLRGEFVATFPYQRNEDRGRDYEFSESLFDVRQYAFYAANAAAPLDTAEAVRGKTLCRAIGWATPPFVQGMFERRELTLIEPHNIAACFRLIAAGTADVMATDAVLADTILADLPKDVVTSIARAPKPLMVMGMYLMFPRGASTSPTYMATFNKGLALLKESGKYDQIVARHIPHSAFLKESPLASPPDP